MEQEQGQANKQAAQDDKVLSSLRAGLIASVMLVLACFTAAILLIGS